MIYMVFTGLW